MKPSKSYQTVLDVRENFAKQGIYRYEVYCRKEDREAIKKLAEKLRTARTRRIGK